MTGLDVAEPQPLWLSLQHTPPSLGISDTPAGAPVGSAHAAVGVAHAAAGADGSFADVAAALVDALVVIADSAVVLVELADSAALQFHPFPGNKFIMLTFIYTYFTCT